MLLVWLAVGAAAVIALGELLIRRSQPIQLLGAAAGLLTGGAVFWFFDRIFLPLPAPFPIAVAAVLAFLGARVGMSAASSVRSAVPTAATDKKLCDTSVIIDGRIADICETGFLDGTLVVPQFVLRELQHVADSPDSARRQRGRRGLDILKRLQSLSSIRVEISDEDPPQARDVDTKLIELGRAMGWKVLTNDFNLNKVAKVRGVEVLNINELANSLRPVVLPGENMRVLILKEGKEHNQGIAYLDDGTMVVVDNARRMISKTVDVTVTSVLQTTAGKMIFGRYDDRSSQAGPERIERVTPAAGA